MIACLDVCYDDPNDRAMVACVLIPDWDQPVSHRLIRIIRPVAPYVPGEFYKREMPCLLAILESIQGQFSTVVVDGYVWLSEDRRPGLGAHLYEALGKTIPVVGVAKTKFKGSDFALSVYHGKESKNPLYVTAVGIPEQEAALGVGQMAGEYRIPTALKEVDHLCRNTPYSP